MELIQAGVNILHSEIHEILNSVWNKEEYRSSGRTLLLFLLIKRAIKLNVVISEAYYWYQLHKNFNQYSCVKFKSIWWQNYCGSLVWILAQ